MISLPGASGWGWSAAHLCVAFEQGWVRSSGASCVTNGWYAPASLGLPPPWGKREMLPVFHPPQKVREGTRSKEVGAYVLWNPGEGLCAGVISFKP